MNSNSDLIVRAEEAVAWLRARGVVLAAGLTEVELDAVEGRFQIQFPPDLRALLGVAMPVGLAEVEGSGTFPDWRSDNGRGIRERLEWPWEGIAFDIERNGFWWDAWGAKPARLEEAIAVAREQVGAAPKLIPIYSHRFIPAEPLLAGNPVLSVYQTDIISYGKNLWNYFENR